MPKEIIIHGEIKRWDKGITSKEECSPKINPFNLVFSFGINEIKQEGYLPLDARIMLYSWAGQIIEMKSEERRILCRVDVNKLIEDCGGIPKEYEDRLPPLGNYLEAIYSFVEGRLESGRLTQSTLELLMSWAEFLDKSKSITALAMKSVGNYVPTVW